MKNRARREESEMSERSPSAARIAAKWQNLPKGWTDESRKEFWETLVGDVKHPVTKCIEKMEGKPGIDDPGAFCAALADRVDPGWRSRREASPSDVALRWANRNDWRGRWLMEQAKDASFTFRKPAIRDLWNDMFAGQISDGMWENTPNTGWEFWTSIPTTLGGKTHLVGRVPGNIKLTFGFDKLIPYVGDEMLDIVQKTEPEATMADVLVYTKEVMKALRAASKGEEVPDPPSASPGAVAPELDSAAKAQTRSIALKVIQDHAQKIYGSVRMGTVGEALLYSTEGGRAGKYHYFAILAIPSAGTGGTYQAYSAYGAVGKLPKAVPLDVTGPFLNMAEKAVQRKAKSKFNSGYRPVKLEGVRKEIPL
jgi:hypothetical protein